MPDSREFPQRRRLPHDTPSWVPSGSLFFLTINCAKRGRAQLTIPQVSEQLFGSLRYQVTTRKWWIELLVLMPDHLHALIAFALGEDLRTSVIAWKRFTARQFGLQWQRDFFDHRIRDDAAHTEKWRYVSQNPVRAGLTAKSEDWPFLWTNVDFLD